jgi:hypothetical protein
MPGFSYPRTVNNRPILDLSIRSELQRNIEHLERTLFESKMPTLYRHKEYTDLMDWEKASEDKEEWHAIEVKYHQEPKVHTDVIKHEYFEGTHTHLRLTHIKILRPPGINSDTLTEIIQNWTGRKKIRVFLP